jgi:ribonuclease D
MAYDIHWIDTLESYQKTLEILENFDTYFLDTEFIRESTYRPIVALIQIAVTANEAYLIDPTFSGFNPELLFNLFKKHHKKIILHSARQDLEIFYFHYHFTPHNLADTQIMAAALGYGEQIGFDGLVQLVTGDIIDKSQQRTNWLKRPLNQVQIDYAASDVIFLAKIYPILDKMMLDKNRYDWIENEINELCNPTIFSFNEKAIIKKIRHKLTKKQAIFTLNQLTLLREKIAIEKDLIRTLVCNDLLLIQLSERQPITEEAFTKIKHFNKSLFNEYRQDVINAIIDAKQKSQEISSTDEHIRTEKLTFQQDKLVTILSLVADIIAHEQSVSRRFFATQNDIIQYVRTHQADFLKGWQYDLFGHVVNDVIAGKKGIFYHNGVLSLK